MFTWCLHCQISSVLLVGMLRYVSELPLKKFARPGDKRKAMHLSVRKGIEAYMKNKIGRQE